jgi:tetratricopeptide (TPR) repeat protein
MQRRPATILTLWLAFHASPGIAAEPPSGGVVASPAQGTNAGPCSDDVDQQYAAARERYEAGDLADAIRIFEQCYVATDDANLLFNLAQLYRELGDCPKAVNHYQQYIDQEPNGERSADAKQHADALRRQCVPTPPEPRTPDLPPPVTSPPPQHTNYWQPIGWIAVGVSAVATAGMVYASVEANHAKRDVERMRDSDSFAYRDLMSRYDDFYAYYNWAFALGATAVVTAGFGAYALGVAAPRARARNQTMSLLVLPNRASVGYLLQF